MLIDLNYGEDRPAILAELADIFSVFKRDWKWSRKRHLYGIEYAWVIDQVLNTLGDLSGKNILDAGGGGGAIQYYLGLRGAEMVNVSLGHGPLVGTTNKGVVLPPVEYITGNMAETGLYPGSLDAVISVSAIEHNEWSHIKKSVEHLAKLLKPGAPMFFTVPAGKERAWHPQGTWQKSPIYPSVYLFDAMAFMELRNLLSPLGETITHIPGPLTYEKKWKDMKKDMDNFPGGHKVPYLSAGYAFIRNNEPA